MTCGCTNHCGDDGDIDGPGTCKGLPWPSKQPVVEVVMVPRSRLDAEDETPEGLSSVFFHDDGESR